MSVHNCALYVEEALGSMLTQPYQNLEIIIFDDGSTDETGQSIKLFIRDFIPTVTCVGLDISWS